MHFKRHWLAGQRVVEVELHGIATARQIATTVAFAVAAGFRAASGLVTSTHLHHRPGVAAKAIGRGELHHIAHAVCLQGVAHVVQQLARHPLHHVGIALAKSLPGGQLKGRARALLQPQQALLNRRRQLTRAERQRGGLAREGVDDVPRRAAKAVVQGEE